MPANDYYDSSGTPATGSAGSSAAVRAEFDLIEVGFNKLPALTGNANKAVVVNSGGTALTVTAAALALAVAFTTAGAGPITLTSTGATNVTLPTTGTLATLAGVETLSNKTLTSPIITTSPTAVGATWADLGTVTTVDINGGTIDGAPIGATTRAAGSFTTLDANGNVTLGDASGDTLTINAGTWTYGNNWTASRSVGGAASGSNTILTTSVSATPHSDGTSTINYARWNTTLSGSGTQSVVVARTLFAAMTVNATVTQATVNNVESTVSITSTGNLSNARVFSGQVAFTSSGSVTGVADGYLLSGPSMGAGGATLATINGFRAANLGATGVTTAVGFKVDDFTNSTNMRGLQSSLTFGTGKYNLYIDQNADNYILGTTGFGGVPIASSGSQIYAVRTHSDTTQGERTIYVQTTVTATSGSFNKAGVFSSMNIGSAFAGTNQMPCFWGQATASNAGTFGGNQVALRTDLSITAAANLNEFEGLYIGSASNTGGGSLLNFYGIYIQAQTVGTNIYGIRSSIAAAANRYNIFADGTAANRFGGQVQLADGSIAAPTLSFTSDTDTGLMWASADRLDWVFGGVRRQVWSAGNLSLGSTVVFTWRNAVDPSGASDDITLGRLSAGVLEQKSGTTAQALNIYRTFTDTSNYERQAIRSGAGYFEWAAETAGTGTDNIDLRITPAGTGVVTVSSGLAVNGSALTSTQTTFNLLNATVTTLNIGAAATTIAIGAADSDTTLTGQSFTLTGANSTNNTVLAVTNTSNAAAASHAYIDISVGGTTSTGDPHIRFTIPLGTSWYAGPDNSASDVFCIGSGTTVTTASAILQLTSPSSAAFIGTLAVNGNALTTDDATFSIINTNATTVNAFGAATAINIGAADSDTTLTGQSFTLTGANTTNNTVLAVTNTTNTAVIANAYVDISVGGTTTTGNPHMRFTIPGGTSWIVGVDNNSSDNWTMATGTNFAVRLFIMDSSGNVTMAGTLAVNGASITTDDTTFNVFNTVATTINAFGAATTLTIGAATVACGIGVAASSSAFLALPAGTTSKSTLRVPHGAAPSAPVDGDIWTTTAGLFVRVNGATVGPLS